MKILYLQLSSDAVWYLKCLFIIPSFFLFFLSNRSECVALYSIVHAFFRVASDALVGKSWVKRDVYTDDACVVVLFLYIFILLFTPDYVGTRLCNDCCTVSPSTANLANLISLQLGQVQLNRSNANIRGRICGYDCKSITCYVLHLA